MNRSEKGFTLIEMIIVIALIGVLSAIAVPSFGMWINDHRLKSAAYNLRGDLHMAKVSAAKNNHQYRVVFSTNGYEIHEGDKRSGSTVWTPKSKQRSFAEFPGISVKTVSTNPVFNPRGTVNNAVTITLENTRGVEKVIQITYAGRIKIG